jgi:flagellar biogenesis protein FliO
MIPPIRPRRAIHHLSLRFTALIVLAAAAIGPAPMWAGEVFTDAEWAATNRTPAPTAGPDAGSLLVVAASLLMVAGLAVGLGWLARRAGADKALLRRGKHLEIVDTVAVGFKRQLTLVKLGDQVILVGQGEHELHTLGAFPATVLDSTATPVRPSEAAAPGPPGPSAFANLLDRIQGTGKHT